MWGLLNVWQAVGFAPFENVVVCPMTIKYRFMREHESVQT